MLQEILIRFWYEKRNTKIKSIDNKAEDKTSSIIKFICFFSWYAYSSVNDKLPKGIISEDLAAQFIQYTFLFFISTKYFHKNNLLLASNRKHKYGIGNNFWKQILRTHEISI